MNDVSVSDSLRRITRTIDELEPVLQSLVVNDTTILDALSQLLGVLHDMQVRSEQAQGRVADEVRQLRGTLSVLQEHVQGATAAPLEQAPVSDQDVETALLCHLYSYVPDPVAIDVGANVGHVAEGLLSAGWEVHAFEPYPPAFAALQARLAGRRGFHAEAVAIGASDGQADFHVAADLSGQNKWDATLFNSLVSHPMLADCKFTSTISVPVRSLDSLQREGHLPATCGLLKIDTEGHDLEVIRGLGAATPHVVMTEFWDAAHPFGVAGHGRLSALVDAMRMRGYRWHLTVYHVDPTHTVSFTCNRIDTVAGSWGNVLFFRQHDVFMRALTWCERALAARRAS